MIPPPAGLRRRRNGSLERSLIRLAREPRPAVVNPTILRLADQQVVG